MLLHKMARMPNIWLNTFSQEEQFSCRKTPVSPNMPDTAILIVPGESGTTDQVRISHGTSKIKAREGRLPPRASGQPFSFKESLNEYYRVRWV